MIPLLPPSRPEALEILASFKTASDLPELLGAAFAACEQAPPAQVPRVIVGGGLAGLLAALRLSSQAAQAQGMPDGGGVTLIESEQALGGRLFFSTPWHGVGSPRSRFEALLERGHFGSQASGPGLEALAPDALAIYGRHLLAHLCEEERSFVDAFTALGAGEGPLSRRCYVVKKEAVPLAAHTAGPTETLTRKDADLVAAIAAAGRGADASDGAEMPHGADAASDTRAPVPFSEFAPWKEAPKAQKENVGPLLETLAGFSYAKFPSAHVCGIVACALSLTQEPVVSWMRRDGGFELALDLVLRLRGVRVRTSARVTRIEKSDRGGFTLLLGDDVYPACRALEASQLFLCVPIARTFGILPREALAAGQSRLVTRHRARSLVSAEYPDALTHLGPVVEGGAQQGDVYLFPVERVRAQVTSRGALVFSAWLDFEDSLQAPPVRDVLARLRRAASRVLTPEALKQYAGREAGIGGVGPAGQPRERVVLAPVGLATPQESVPTDLCTDPRASWKGLYVCGDGFTVSPLPWKNVVHSVHEACTHAKELPRAPVASSVDTGALHA